MDKTKIDMRWRLRDFLQKRGHTVLQLEDESGISRATLYRITSPNPPKKEQRVDFPTLATLIGTLRELTGENVTPNDLIEFVPDVSKKPEPEKKTWRSLAGSFDDPDGPIDVAKNHDHYLSEALLKEHQEGLEGER